MRWPRRKRIVIPVGRKYTLLREPLYRKGRRDAWLEALLWVVGFVAIGLLYRGVIS